MAQEKVIPGLIITGPLSSGVGHELLTRHPTTGLVTSIPSASSPLTNSLPSGQFFVGNNSNIATAVSPSGDVVFDNTGAFNISSGVIVDADISSTAGINITKLATLTPNRATVTDASGYITSSSITATEQSYLSGASSNIQSQINTKQPIITGAATTITAVDLSANRVLVSSAAGKVAVGNPTTTEINYVSGVTSPIQTQLNTKLPVSLSNVQQGDLVYYDGANWINIARGTMGQVLTATSTTIQWSNSSASGLPSGGTTNQYLKKNSNTDFDTSWDTLQISDITDITASAAEINITDGLLASTAELNFSVGVTSPIQTQLDNKLDNYLPYNHLFIGNAGNTPVPFAPGPDGYVITSVSGVPTWVIPTPPGNVSGPGIGVTDNAIVRWNTTSGDSIQNSIVIVDDSGNISGMPTLRTTTVSSETLLLQAYDVDGATYTTFATLTAGNTPTFDLSDSTTKAGQYIYRASGTDVSLADGGTGASLSDPGYDGVFVWDNTLNQTRIAQLSGITYDSGTNTLTGSAGGSAHVIENSGTPLTDRANLNITNGLTASDNTPDTDVLLGGDLIQDTEIRGSTGTYRFDVTELIGGSFLNQAGYGIQLASNSVTLTNGASVSIQATAGGVSMGDGTRLLRFTSSGVEFDFGSDAQGDTLYRDGSGFLVRRPIGSEGQVYTVSSGIPVWAAAPATYTDEQAQDAVGNILLDSSTINFTYDDATPTITGIVIDNSITFAKRAQLTGPAVVGRSANTLGNEEAITATTNGYVLRRASDALAWGLLDGTNFSSQSASTFFGGPTSGSATATFRLLDPIDLPFPTRTQSGATYTIQASDLGYSIYFTNSGGCTVTLPSTLPTNFWFNAVRAEAAGTITFIAGGSSVLNTVNDEVTIDFEHGAVSWEYKGSNDWYGWGTLGTTAGGGGSGTVTSVNVASISGLASSSGGPITGSGTITLTLDTQSANTVLAGPISGSSATSAFRLLDMLDTPRPAKEVSSATYTVLNADLGYNIYFTNSTGCTVTLNSSITVSNFWFTAIRDKAMTSGSLVFSAGGSAILNTVNGELSISEANGAASWEYKGSNDWYGWGTLGSGSGSSAHVIENSGTPLTQRANLNFSNGITAADNTPDTDVKLGGILTENTTIGGADTYAFVINNMNSVTITPDVNTHGIQTNTSNTNIYGNSGASAFRAWPTGDIEMFRGTQLLRFTASGTELDLGSDATGDVYYRNSSGILTRLGVGAATTVFGGGTTPSYKAVSNGLTADATTLKLGGPLTANTTLSGNFNLTLGNSGFTFGKLVVDAVGMGTDPVIFGAYNSGGNGVLVLQEITATSSTRSTYNIEGSGGYFRINSNNSSQTETFVVYNASSQQMFNVSTASSGSVTSLMKHQFTRSASRASMNLGATAGDASASLTNSDLWYNSTTHKFMGRRNSITESFVTAVSPTVSEDAQSLRWNNTSGIWEYYTPSGGGSGTVTSVAATAPTAGFTISGSPITTSGTLTFALADDLAGLEAQSGTGLTTRTSTNTYANRSIAAGTGIAVSNGNGVSGNPTVSLSHLGIQSLVDPNADRLMGWNNTTNDTQWVTVGAGLSLSGNTITQPTTLESGVYTPTLTNTTNVTSSTPRECTYIRVGNVVSVSGRIEITPTTGSDTSSEIGISLPISSNLAEIYDLSGVGTDSNNTDIALLNANSTDDRVRMSWNANVGGVSTVWMINFQYQII